MSDFTSGFSTKIQEYLAFRNALGFSDDHKKHLLRFDMYCSKFGKTGNILTKVLCVVGSTTKLLLAGIAWKTRHQQFVSLPNISAMILISSLRIIFPKSQTLSQTSYLMRI